MRPAAPRPQVYERSAGNLTLTKSYEISEPSRLQRWPHFRFPFIPFRVGVFRINILLRVFQPCLNLFQVVRFLTDVPDLIDQNMSSLQQTDRLLVACLAMRVRAFRLGMVFVLAQDIAVSANAGSVAVAVVTRRGDPVLLSGILINPAFS